jgi:enoyl-CoA hydratase/carnithine racemase
LIAMDEAMAQLGKPLVAGVNGNAHAGGFGLMVACDLAVAADDATFGLPEAASGLFPFIALTIVRDALPKKVLFDVIYRARLMTAAEALSLHLINEVLPRARVLSRAIALAEQASAYDREIVALGRGLYYETRSAPPADAMAAARQALLAAVTAVGRSRR